MRLSPTARRREGCGPGWCFRIARRLARAGRLRFVRSVPRPDAQKVEQVAEVPDPVLIAAA